MSIRQLIGARVSKDPTYECAFCRLEYDEDRPNCPACGFPVREAA